MFDPSWNSAMQSLGRGTCDGCKYWSELIANVVGNGEMKAACLNPESHRYQAMVAGGCDKYAAGTSVDCPIR